MSNFAESKKWIPDYADPIPIGTNRGTADAEAERLREGKARMYALNRQIAIGRGDEVPRAASKLSKPSTERKESAVDFEHPWLRTCWICGSQVMCRHREEKLVSFYRKRIGCLK